MRAPSIALLLAALAAGACPGRPFDLPVDLPADRDAGVVPTDDAGALVDAGPPDDAGTVDDDAGASPDAGDEDGGVDAGPVDSGREFGLEERVENTTCKLDGAAPLALPSLITTPAYAALAATDVVSVVPVPGTAELLAVGRAGRVHSFASGGDGSDAVVVLDLAGAPTGAPTGGVDALLGVAPDVDGALYATYVPTGALGVVVSRFRAGVEDVLLDVALADTARAGGSVRFGHDGMLYVALGDGGAPLEARELSSLRGKLLRIDVRTPPVGALPYVVPADNPFVDDVTARPEIFARGLGDPTCSFDRITGRLWCADRGGDVASELGFVPAGADLGWPRMEASTCLDPPVGCQDGTLTVPLLSLARANTCAAEGGLVVRDAALPELQGAVLVADRCSGLVRGLRFDGRTVRALGDVLTLDGGVRGFGEDADGAVLLIGSDGAIRRFARAPGDDAPTFPATLSQTGCYADVAAHALAPGLVPFEVRAPLWTDGAQKVRALALPGTTTVDFTTTGSWGFPDGALFLKEFNHPETGRAMETRLLVKRTASQWEGYSFMWNREGTDAWLLDGSELATWTADAGDDPTSAPAHRHVYPGRADCLLCHNGPAGRALGLQTGRLNAEHDYDGFVDNQLRSMEHIGLFSAPLPAPPAELPRFANLDDDDATDEERARAWMGGNCAHCHRPLGPANVQIDLRFETAFADTLTCNRVPERGDLGVAGALIIKPGLPDESELFLRMSRRGNQQMPPLGTLVVEPLAETTLRAWIAGLAGCP